MSSGHKALSLTPEDAKKIIAAEMHVGHINCNFQMNQYVYKRNKSGNHILSLNKMWQKLVLAARIIAAVDVPEDVCVVSSNEIGHRAIIKFSKFVGTISISGRFSPGSLTNHIQSGYKEPRVIIITDPTIDHQAVREASYVNIPIIALCNTNTPLKYIDVAIPCNNSSAKSIGLAWWMLAREVLRLRGTLSRSEPWEVMPDLFFFREDAEIEKQESDEQERKKRHAQTDDSPNAMAMDDNYNQDADQNMYQDNMDPNLGAADDWAVNKDSPAAGATDWAEDTGAGDTGDWAAEATAGQTWGT